MKPLFPMIGSLLIAAVATSAVGQDEIDPAVARAVNARQAHMDLNAFNLSLLGAMAKGEVEYDATSARAAADNLAALSLMDETRYWLEGTDMETLGKDKTAALSAIWSDDSEFADRARTLAESAAAMADVAGDGLDALRGAMAPLGKSCGGCHEDYRASRDD